MVNVIFSVTGHQIATKRKIEYELERGLQLTNKRKIEDGITAPKFSDIKENPLGSVPNILFWNDPQRQVYTQVVNMQSTLLMGDYGTGLGYIVISSS